MDVNFKCPHCAQDLSVDAAGVGTEIQCPTCNEAITVPAPPPVQAVNPINASAAAREEKHFAVPVHDKPVESLIAKALPPLEVSAREGISLRVKTMRHSDHVEVGKDHFDEHVTQFLEKIGEAQVVSVSTFNYTHQELATRAWVTDYGVMVVYRG